MKRDNKKLRRFTKAGIIWVKGNCGRVSGRMNVYGYTNKDVATLLGIKETSLRNMITKGFKIGALEEICMAYLKRR